MSEVLGIDVSHHNGKIDWEAVAKNGKRFAILKCQYEAKSHKIDETFEYNWREAGKAGLSRGVYVFIASDSIADPVADATALITKLKGRSLEYGIWLDYESAALKKLSKAKINELTYVYANIFRGAGYYVGIYCNKDWYDNVLDSKTLAKDFDFWIARYPRSDTGIYNPSSSLKPSKYAVAWQYSSKGNVPGIKTRVDLNVDFDGVVNLMANDLVGYRKTNRQIAEEVLANKWGTKDTKPSREELLRAAGYDPVEIQKIVNSIYYKKAK